MRLARTALAATLALGASGAGLAQPRDNTEAEIEKYRQMLQDGNPAELVALKGEGLWKRKQGPKAASLEACDLGLGPGVVKGANAQMILESFEARIGNSPEAEFEMALAQICRIFRFRLEDRVAP